MRDLGEACQTQCAAFMTGLQSLMGSSAGSGEHPVDVVASHILYTPCHNLWYMPGGNSASSIHPQVCRIDADRACVWMSETPHNYK